MENVWFIRDLHSPVPRDIVGHPLPPYPDSPAPILQEGPVEHSLCFDNGGKGKFPPLEMEGEQTKPEVGPGDLDLESHHEEPDREDDPEYHEESNHQDVGGRVCPERLPDHDLQDKGIPGEYGDESDEDEDPDLPEPLFFSVYHALSRGVPGHATRVGVLRPKDFWSGLALLYILRGESEVQHRPIVSDLEAPNTISQLKQWNHYPRLPP